MKSDTYDFRQFQKDLAELDRNKDAVDEKQTPAAEPAQARLLQARAEFTALRKRYRLTVAHVVAFFPEEEGLAYLERLVADLEGTRKRGRRATRSRDAVTPTDG